MADLFGEPEIATVAPDGADGQKERGAFYTPDGLALAIARVLAELLPKPLRIFEPGCGGGAFLRAARATWPQAQLLGVDLLPACTGPGIVRQQDLFDPAIPNGVFDLVLGNPDFTIAERAVRRGMDLLEPGGHVALLLLASFEESRERIPFWGEYPLWARKAIGYPRPCFRADGQTDMRPYAVMVWKKGERAEHYRGLSPLVWR